MLEEGQPGAQFIYVRSWRVTHVNRAHVNYSASTFNMRFKQRGRPQPGAYDRHLDRCREPLGSVAFVPGKDCARSRENVHRMMIDNFASFEAQLTPSARQILPHSYQLNRRLVCSSKNLALAALAPAS